MEIFDVVVTIESTGHPTRYAQYCPAGVGVEEYCKKLIELVLLAPSSLRVITVPGTNLTIDRLDVESVLVATST